MSLFTMNTDNDGKYNNWHLDFFLRVLKRMKLHIQVMLCLIVS